MSDKTKHKSEANAFEKARGFWEDYSKVVISAGVAIIVIVAGWLIYKYMFQLPKEKKANDIVFVTQKYFKDFTTTTDSTKAMLAAKVINGDGTNPGALKIINQYSGSDAANLSKYYAGASYLHLGQFDKAIKFLKDFDADGSTQIKSRTLGMLGDASAELGKNDEALNYYKKAADVNAEDAFTTSEFLFRAALFAESIGKTKEAITLYKKIKSGYPLTEKAAEVDRYLARLGEFSE